jgi:uncharacterized protein (DUF4415 family)
MSKKSTRPAAKRGAWLKSPVELSERDLISLRLERDVIEAFRATGKGYQTLINEVLRLYAEEHLKRRKRD